MGVVGLSNSVNTQCHSCDGSGFTHKIRQAAVVPVSLDHTLSEPRLQGRTPEHRVCADCAGQGWLPGLVAPV